MAGMIPEQAQAAPPQQMPAGAPQGPAGAPAPEQGGQIDPAQQELAQRFQLAAQAIISSKKGGDSVVEMASQGSEPFAKAAMLVLAMIEKQAPVSEEDLPIAMMVIVMELFAFLVKIGAVNEDPEGLKQVMAMSFAQLVPRIGFDQEDQQGMNEMMPGVGDLVAEIAGGGAPQEQPGQPPAAPAQAGQPGMTEQGV